MSKTTVKAVGTVSKELLKWFTDRAETVGTPRTALIAMAMHDYKIKKESEANE